MHVAPLHVVGEAIDNGGQEGREVSWRGREPGIVVSGRSGELTGILVSHNSHGVEGGGHGRVCSLTQDGVGHSCGIEQCCSGSWPAADSTTHYTSEPPTLNVIENALKRELLSYTPQGKAKHNSIHSELVDQGSYQRDLPTYYNYTLRQEFSYQHTPQKNTGARLRCLRVVYLRSTLSTSLTLCLRTSGLATSPACSSTDSFTSSSEAEGGRGEGRHLPH